MTTTTDRKAIVSELIEKFVLDHETADSLLRIDDDEDERLEEKFKVEIKVKNGVAKVKVKLKFILDTTDRESILSATTRSSRSSIALKTAPMPPIPIRFSNR